MMLVDIFVYAKEEEKSEKAHLLLFTNDMSNFADLGNRFWTPEEYLLNYLCYS